MLGCDLQATETVFPAHVTFLQENVFERTEDFERLLDGEGPFDLVMSDMAPRTTGTRFTDQARSLELCLEAVEVAEAGRKLYRQDIYGTGFSGTGAGSEKALFHG